MMPSVLKVGAFGDRVWGRFATYGRSTTFNSSSFRWPRCASAGLREGSR